MDRKRIFVYGYRQVNLGDDLFYYVLFSRYKQVDFVFCAPREYRKIYSEFDNVTIYPENRLFLAVNRVLANLFKGKNIRTWISRSCDAAVFIIGSCLGENKGGKNRYYFEPSPDAVDNIFIIGANIGKVYTEKHLAGVAGYLKKCKDVCFRETRSRDLFAGLSNVRMAPDVVFQLGKTQKKVQARKKVLFSVIDMYSRNHLKEYAEEYEKLIRRLIGYFQKKNYEILFMSFCDTEGDNRFVQKLVEEYREDGVKFCSYCGNIEDTLEQIQECEVIVATRFHSMILAWTYGRRVLPIIYDPKMQHVIDDYQYAGSYVKMNDMGDFQESDISKWMEEEIFDPTDCIKKSEGQFKGLDEYVNGS